ncbi:MAG TPA: hypothetical protein VLR91_01915 [Thermodesulfobacteriota bacterium]|nr:hypothetical protein [Thermodesulfobacteriota bacterium]
MIKKLTGLAGIALIFGGLLIAGCAGRQQYVSPYVQEESNPTYKQLYPNPFTLSRAHPAPAAGMNKDWPSEFVGF